jgi:cytochrome c553
LPVTLLLSLAVVESRRQSTTVAVCTACHVTGAGAIEQRRAPSVSFRMQDMRGRGWS